MHAVTETSPIEMSSLAAMPVMGVDPVRTLSEIGRAQNVAAGEVVIPCGARVQDVIVVESGCLLKMGENETIVDSFGPRHIVAGKHFLDGSVCPYEVLAQRASRIVRIPRGDLFRALENEPARLRLVLDAIAKDSRAQSTPEEYVRALGDEALRHRAVTHPYLRALTTGSLPDTRQALRDFATHYYGYSSHFPRYLTTVISRLEVANHRKALVENLMEESGIYGEDEYAELAEHGVEREWIEGVPHPALFQRFARAVDARFPAPHEEADDVVCWREMFLTVLAHGSPAEAVGALGLGTEQIVSTIYLPFVAAIRTLPDLSARDTVFFPLHTAVDDHHQETLRQIAVDFAATPDGRAGLRRGMLKSLALRSSFWDWLYGRATTSVGRVSLLP